jgi:hypothetical protein
MTVAQQSRRAPARDRQPLAMSQKLTALSQAILSGLASRKVYWLDHCLAFQAELGIEAVRGMLSRIDYIKTGPPLL